MCLLAAARERAAMLACARWQGAPVPAPVPRSTPLIPFAALCLALPQTQQDEDAHMSLREILATPRGRVTVACDALALIGMAPFVVIEVGGCGWFKGAAAWASAVLLLQTGCWWCGAWHCQPAGPDQPSVRPGLLLHTLLARCARCALVCQVSTMAAYGWGWATVWNVLDAATYAIQASARAAEEGRQQRAAHVLAWPASSPFRQATASQPHLAPPPCPPLLWAPCPPACLPRLPALASVAQVAIIVMHLGRLNISSDYLSILAAAQCILLLLRWAGWVRAWPHEVRSVSCPQLAPFLLPLSLQRQTGRPQGSDPSRVATLPSTHSF